MIEPVEIVDADRVELTVKLLTVTVLILIELAVNELTDASDAKSRPVLILVKFELPATLNDEVVIFTSNGV